MRWQIGPIQVIRLEPWAIRYEESYSVEMPIKLTRNRVLVALNNLIEVIGLVYDRYLAVQPIQKIMHVLPDHAWRPRHLVAYVLLSTHVAQRFQQPVALEP